MPTSHTESAPHAKDAPPEEPALTLREAEAFDFAKGEAGRVPDAAPATRGTTRADGLLEVIRAYLIGERRPSAAETEGEADSGVNLSSAPERVRTPQATVVIHVSTEAPTNGTCGSPDRGSEPVPAGTPC